MKTNKTPGKARAEDKRVEDKRAEDKHVERQRAATDPFDVDAIRALAAAVAEHGLSELTLERGDARLVLRRGSADTLALQAPPPAPHAGQSHPLVPSTLTPPLPPYAPPPVPLAMVSSGPMALADAPAAVTATPPHPAIAPNGTYATVNSPFVGTFYRAPSPGAPSFVDVGQRVKKGQVLCIVEAMKLMNEIEAEQDGAIVSCLVDNAQPVEYGQPLFKISV